MYGLILENFRCVIIEKFGESIWNKIVEKSGTQHYTFAMHKIYSENLMARLIQAVFEVTKHEKEEIFEDVGLHFLGFIGQYGYDRILKVLGRHMRDFLSGLDNLHEYLRFTYPKLRAPSFFCDEETENGLKLYYRSSRKGFVYYVVGQIKAVGRFFYHIDVDVRVLDYSESKEGSTTIFQLTFDNSVYMQSRRKLKRHSVISLNNDSENLKIQMDVFYEVFPFHIVYDQNMVISSTGNSLEAVLPGLPGNKITTQFTLIRPFVQFTWQTVMTHTNVVFELQALVPNALAEGHALALQNGDATTSGDDSENGTHSSVCYIHLKGQMLFMEEWHSMVYLATPIIEKLDVMRNLGLYINDLSMHDSSRDLVLAGTQQSAELRLALDQELQKSAKLEESMKELDIEKRRTDSLLYQMIPRSVADRLRQGEPALNTCEMFHDVSVLFSDVVGFTQICSLISPMEVVTMLNNMYTSFDQISEQHNVYKVETIGDAYMVVSGVPERSTYHAEHVADLALNMISAMPALPDPSHTLKHLRIRIGIHTGMVVAGVVGLKMPRYCLFGDTVNTASRMESTGQAMRIHISETTQNCLKNVNYVMIQRGSIDIKGKGGMKTYWLLGKRDGGEEAQSFMSFVGGSRSTAIGGMCEEQCLSTLANAAGNQLGADHRFGDETELLQSEEVVLVSEAEENPVAYYGHVPHDQSPAATNNDGVHFKFRTETEQVKVKETVPAKVEETANGQQHVQSNKDEKKKSQESSKPPSTVSTLLCKLL